MHATVRTELVREHEWGAVQPAPARPIERQGIGALVAETERHLTRYPETVEQFRVGEFQVLLSVGLALMVVCIALVMPRVACLGTVVGLAVAFWKVAFKKKQVSFDPDFINILEVKSWHRVRERISRFRIRGPHLEKFHDFRGNRYVVGVDLANGSWKVLQSCRDRLEARAFAYALLRWLRGDDKPQGAASGGKYTDWP